MNRKIGMAAAMLAMAALALTACARRAEAPEYAADALEPRLELAAGGAPAGRAKLAASPAAGQPSPTQATTPVATPATPGATPQAVDGRKLVYTADMRIEVKDLKAAEASALSALEAAGGYAQSRSATESSVYMVLRLPAARLGPMMDSLAGGGKTLSRSVSADDVTDQFFDLEGRLRNKRILEERFRAYLREAKTVSDMLDVEARLSETTNEIEWLEGSFRELGKRIELATLTLELVPVRAADPSRPSLGEALARFFAGAGDVFRTGAVFLVGLLVYGVPALLLAALAWWLSFGKVGLLRRLFGLVRASKK